MFRKVLWYTFGWAFLGLTYPMLWRVKYLEWQGRNKERDVLVNKVIVQIARVLFYLTGSKFRIIGLDNVPKEGAVLFVSNHEGHADSLIIQGYIDKPKGFIADEDALKIPILSKWMTLSKCVFINRNDARQALICINKGIDILKQNHSLVIYPEGKLSDGGPIGEFKRGWLRLATKSGVPIVPISIKGTYNIVSKYGDKVQASLVECVISKPIYIDNLNKDKEAEFIENIRTIILKNMPHN